MLDSRVIIYVCHMPNRAQSVMSYFPIVYGKVAEKADHGEARAKYSMDEISRSANVLRAMATLFPPPAGTVRTAVQSLVSMWIR